MNNPLPATPHDVSPALALAVIKSFEGPLLLDLDETLYLRSSTEDFIDQARPAALAAMLMKVLDWIKPWRWSGGDTTRDVWRIQLVLWLFPWTARLWRKRLPDLVRRYANRPLLEAVHAHASRPYIVTQGFQPVVKPLVAALNLGDCMVAATLPTFRSRLTGKLQLAKTMLGEDIVRRALVISDSIDDLPLLNACAKPLRAIWPGARYRVALSDVYLPGLYLSRIKRPGERYILRGILQDDFAFWLIASVGLAPVPLAHLTGLLFLLLSFWTIYECGYVDNDRIAERYEKEPKLSVAFYAETVATPFCEPWIWSAISAAIAIPLLRWPAVATPADFGLWLLLLLTSHAWFRLYNRFDKPTRVWLYPGLQLARCAAFAVLVPVAAIGMVALSAHLLAKWLPYHVYRCAGNDWPETSLPLTRLVLFMAMALLLVLTQGSSTLFNGTAAALLAWNLFRARHDLRAAVINAKRLDRPAGRLSS